MDFFQVLLAALDITLPILMLLGLGLWLKRIKFITPDFAAVGNRLVFSVTLPCLLFLSTATRPLSESLNVALVIYASLAVVITTFLLWKMSPMWVAEEKRGVFVQCAFRGNLGIIGLAMCLNAYGTDILAMAGVFMALLTVLYNVLAVLLLSKSKTQSLLNLGTNPLIIAVVLGLSWQAFDIPVPVLMHKTGSYLAQMTLPLALLCIGASLQWQSFKTNHRDVVLASLLRLVVVPLIIVGGGVVYGFRGIELGVLTLMMSSSTAAASYVMAKQLTKHGLMAAEIVALTTVFVPFTASVGWVFLSLNELL